MLCSILSAITFALGIVAESKMKEEAYTFQIIMAEMASSLPVGFTIGVALYLVLNLLVDLLWVAWVACFVSFAAGVAYKRMTETKKHDD